MTPWGIYEARLRDAEEETKRAQAAAAAAIALEHAELARERAELERAAEAARTGTPGPTPGPMSRAEPAPGPMSRPEPTPRPLAAPPMAYTLRTEAPLAHQGPQPKLTQRSVKRNAVIDVDAWFLAHGLSLPTWDVPSRSPFGGGPSPGSSGDPLPSEISTTLAGGGLRTAIRGADHSIAIHSEPRSMMDRSVVVRDAIGDALGAFELSAWPPEQELHWAQAQDGVLFMCTYHMTYASSTGGSNAFITAVSLATGELLWQSEPVVCNTWNFLLRDGWIITGYGFTAEPDFLFVLDAKTGAVAWKKKLASGPEVILEKAGTLYVRTYDRDYEFAIR